VIYAIEKINNRYTRLKSRFKKEKAVETAFVVYF